MFVGKVCMEMVKDYSLWLVLSCSYCSSAKSVCCYLTVFKLNVNFSLTLLCAAGENNISVTQSLQFDFKTIETATGKFSGSNMLGQGGFGEVYKV